MGFPAGFSLVVVVCGAHPLHFPSWLAPLTYRPLLTRPWLKAAINDVKPQENPIRSQKELVKTGELAKQQARKGCCLCGEMPWEAPEPWARAGLLSPARLAFRCCHSPHSPASPPGRATRRLLGGVNTACSAAPTRTTPEQDGAGRHPAGTAGRGDKAKF